MRTRRLFNERSLSLLLLLVLAPLAPLGADVEVATLPVVNVTGTSVTFRGQLISDEGIRAEWSFGYWLKTDPSQFKLTEAQCCVSDGGIFETTVTGLLPNTGYHWWAQVSWIDESGNRRSTVSPDGGFTTPCPEAMCMDFNRTGIVDPFDLIAIIGQLGTQTDPSLVACEYFDSPLCPDGYTEAFDVSAFQWALGNTSELLNLCGAAVTSSDGGLPLASGPFALGADDPASAVPAPILPLDDDFAFGKLLCVGKTSWNVFNFVEAFASLQSQSVFALGAASQVIGSARLQDTFFGREPSVGRLSRGQDGRTYMTAIDQGVYRIDPDGTVAGVLASGQVYQTDADSRYGVPANVYVGLQKQGSAVYGRPLWDVARDLFGTLYVAPVVVVPLGQDPYLSVAPLWASDEHASGYDLASNASGFYHINLYDPLDPDNPHLTNIREIGLDGSLNLYALNVNQNDQGTILWRHLFGAGLDENCLYLTGPLSPVDLPDPIGLCVSDRHQTVFLGSSQANPDDPFATILYGFASHDLNNVRHQIRITGMAQVTDITEDPATGDLWVIGFRKDETRWLGLDAILQVNQSFNIPYLARIPSQDIASQSTLTVTANPFAGNHSVDLPLSVAWTGN